MDSSKSSTDGTKRNLPLLRAVKEGKTAQISQLLESGDVNVNFQNHCAPAIGRRWPSSCAPASLTGLLPVGTQALACARMGAPTRPVARPCKGLHALFARALTHETLFRRSTPSVPWAHACRPGKPQCLPSSADVIALTALAASARRRADGDTALILAAWYGHVDITKLLLEARADVDATNCDGNCALNCAAYHGFMEVASLLVDASATIDVRDNVTGACSCHAPPSHSLLSAPLTER